MAGGGRRALVVPSWWAVASLGSRIAMATGSSELALPSEWRDPEKRGGMIHDGVRRLASCDTVEITGGYASSEGFYTQEGTRNGESLFVSSDGTSELFYSNRDDETRRRWRNRRLPEDLFADVGDEGEKEDDEEDGRVSRRRLGACSAGLWTLAPVGGAYPHLTVADCAEHPADIKVTSWKEITCATCGEQTFGDTDPAIVCYYGEVGETESGSGSGSGGDDEGSDDDGGNGAVESPSPSAAGEGGVTIDVNGLCKVLDVGGRFPGLYTVVGSYNDRGDYYSENLSHNIYFELESSSGSANSGGGDDDGGNNNNRRRVLDAVLAAEPSMKDGGGRNLAACDSGYWIKTPIGGGYPFFAVADCVDYPQNIASSSPWLVVNCDGCSANTATSAQGIACATGADAFVSTPAPVAPVASGPKLGPTLPGAGASDCEAVTVTGARAGEYTVVGDINGRADLRSDDGDYRFYWGSPAPSLETNGDRKLGLEGGHGDAVLDGSPQQEQRQRQLDDCDGYWYITPVDSRYPAYAVWDCAYHPTDIISTNWLLLDCESCEVETASPRPDASCTGATAAEEGKRGATATTPSPTVFDADATRAPQSSAVSTCTDLFVTGDFAGNYTANGTYRGKLDFFNSDGSYNLYFELAESRRALWAEEEAGGGGGEGGGGKALLPGDVLMASRLTEAAGATQSLAVCTSGYWILAPVSGDGYPVFGVPDCAEHPADIRSNAWLVASCATCGVQDAPSFVAPTIACAEDTDATLPVGGGASSSTPAPASPQNCGIVYVTGPAGGVYGQRGTHGNRADFFSDNSRNNLYWAFYAGKPVNRNRFRRGLSAPDGVYGAGEGGEWSDEYDLALQTLAAGFGRDEISVGSSIDVAVGAGVGDASVERRQLEFCDDGFWLITPKGGGFPFYGTQNCADHPADMSNFSPWSVVECDGCGSHPLNETVTFSCDGEGYTPPPSTAAAPSASAIGGTPSPADEVGDAGSNGASGIKGGLGFGIISGFLGGAVSAIALRFME